MAEEKKTTLEEAAQQNSDKYAVEDILERPYHYVDDAFIAGAKWQKEQMLKVYIPKETAKKIARGSLGVQDFMRKIDEYKEDKQ